MVTTVKNVWAPRRITSCSKALAASRSGTPGLGPPEVGAVAARPARGRLARGHARLEHAEDRGDAVLRDARRLLETRDLARALDHSGSPEGSVGLGDGRAGQPPAEPLPGGRGHARLAHR